MLPPVRPNSLSRSRGERASRPITLDRKPGAYAVHETTFVADLAVVLGVAALTSVIAHRFRGTS